MENDKRTGQLPVPENLEDWLNHTQMQMLHNIERLGFRLIFMRRPVFKDPIPVIISGNGKDIGILEKDGRINMEADLILRDKSDK